MYQTDTKSGGKLSISFVGNSALSVTTGIDTYQGPAPIVDVYYAPCPRKEPILPQVLFPMLPQDLQKGKYFIQL
jgi:hypothetical protein